MKRTIALLLFASALYGQEPPQEMFLYWRVGPSGTPWQWKKLVIDSATLTLDANGTLSAKAQPGNADPTLAARITALEAEIAKLNAAIAAIPAPVQLPKFGSGLETTIVNGVVTEVRLAAAPPDPLAVVLRWDASVSAGVTGYNLYRRSGSGAYAKLNTAPVNGTEYTDAGVASGSYTYQAKAVSDTGIESASSNEAVAVVP